MRKTAVTPNHLKLKRQALCQFPGFPVGHQKYGVGIPKVQKLRRYDAVTGSAIL